MGDRNERSSVTLREILKLAGTAAAFCASSGYLRAGQRAGAIQDKH